VSYRFLDHTADVGVEIAAPSLGDLFSEAAAAFTDTVTVHSAVRAAEERRVEATADGLEELMVDWLGELLYLFDSEGLLVGEAEVEIARAEAAPESGAPESGWHLSELNDDRGLEGGWHLSARVHGEVYEPERHPVKVLIKAVTYHELVVRKSTEGGWFARVIFDI
jgi:SHS2 domain-containing protein